MIQYDLEVLSLYTAAQENGLPDVVKRATWRYQAKDGSWVADTFQDTYFDPPDPASYHDYQHLDPDVVTSWIVAKTDMDQLQSALRDQLDQLRDPARVTERSRPWDYVNFYQHSDRYVLFHEGEVLWGPLHWNSDSFNAALKRVGLEASFPNDIHVRQRRILPVWEPLTVNAATNTVLYKCELLNDQPEDSIFDQNEHLTWDLSAWPVTGTYEVIPRPLSHIRDRLQDHLERVREQRVTAGVSVTFRDQEIAVDSDTSSRFKILEKYLAMADSDTALFQDQVNASWVSVTKPELFAVMQSMHQHMESVEQWYKDCTETIRSADTVEQLRDLYRSLGEDH